MIIAFGSRLELILVCPLACPSPGNAFVAPGAALVHFGQLGVVGAAVRNGQVGVVAAVVRFGLCCYLSSWSGRSHRLLCVPEKGSVFLSR